MQDKRREANLRQDAKGWYQSEEPIHWSERHDKKVNVKGRPKNLSGDMELIEEDVVRTTALFDGGSDGGCHMPQLSVISKH